MGEVYGNYIDSAGNWHWTDTESGEHTIPASEYSTWDKFIKDEEKPLTPSEQKKKEWEGQNRLYEIAKSYNLVDLDRFRIGKE